ALSDLLGFGSKTVLAWLSTMMLYQANSLLVGYFQGPVVLAIYSRQRALVMHAIRFLRQYAQVFAPATSSLEALGDDAGIRRLLVNTSKYGLYVSLPLLMLLAIMG